MILMTNRLLVTAGCDLSIKIWEWENLENAKCIKTLNNAHSSYIQALLEIPGNILVSGGYICPLKTWDFNDDYKNLAATKEKIKTYVLILIG